ncbi:hypothetical protein GZH47_33235 (plasmid) [Paenibacillus rhizovicinus]|uniref:Uncharacterized protein n=1 Tax=Paenibacillus rhizovicinus TaxID=2704463 RepID=A0A6C0PBD6_9BACL|nr:hypothetical protein [Paenibacillus rhizovicinus]QHW35759.1 hypothetical protein GZH47_33235 [Paenibacillus rhizovicinus]
MSDLLQEALLSEDVSMLDEMMEMLANVKAAGGHVPQEVDEMTIRRMMIRMKINEREISKDKKMKSAIVETWDGRIKKKEEEVKTLRAFIERWIIETNKGKPLQLDVGTASTRKVPHAFEIKDPILFREWLKSIGKEATFLKPQELDVTAAKADIIEYVDKNADEMAEAELKKLQEENPDKKFTKAELKRRKDELIAGYIPALVAKVGLPENVGEYKAEGQSVNLRFA